MYFRTKYMAKGKYTTKFQEIALSPNVHILLFNNTISTAQVIRNGD